MIERAIENWLINTTERNYQAPFCQVLLRRGHKVIFSSSHGPMEQGKDVVTIDNTGNCCCYQLKSGKINLNRWREIRPQVMELITLPFKHSSIDKKKVHKSFLVTNRAVTDTVIIQIDEMNEDNKRKGRKYSYLDIINGQTLLKKFIDAQGEFIPKALEDFYSFLKLFLGDGTDFLPKDKYFDFLNNAIFKTTPTQKSNAINAISSSVVITAYLLNTYQIHKNYYAIFEGWTSLVACIVRYAQRAMLKRENWNDSLNLIASEIVRNLSLLKEETLGKKYLVEGSLLGDGGLIYRARVTILLGTLATLEVHHRMKDRKYVQDKKLLELIKKEISTLWFWGESAFPYFYNLIKYLEINGEGQIAQSLLETLFLSIVNKNSPMMELGLPNPYYSVNDIIELLLEYDSRKIDLREFPGGSYILEIIVLMIVRRNRRELLEKNWRKLSHIRFKEFKPSSVQDTFTWRTKEGSNNAAFPKATQSWAELVKEANDLNVVPNLFSEYTELLRFFILVCPHRTNKLIIALLDQNH